MPRKPLIRSNEFPYHVTGRGNNREHFKCPLYEVWSVFGEHLFEISERFQVKIHAFVLMPNHFHLLLTTPQEDLGVVMRYFMCSVTKTLNSKASRSGRVFGARYHGSLVSSANYLDCVTKYIYRNPVKAQLVQRVEYYQFSTLPSLTAKTPSAFPLRPTFGHETLIPNNHINDFLEWLNEPFANEQEEEIRLNLRKTKFSPLKRGRKKKAYWTSDFDARPHGK